MSNSTTVITTTTNVHYIPAPAKLVTTVSASVVCDQWSNPLQYARPLSIVAIPACTSTHTNTYTHTCIHIHKYIWWQRVGRDWHIHTIKAPVFAPKMTEDLAISFRNTLVIKYCSCAINNTESGYDNSNNHSLRCTVRTTTQVWSYGSGIGKWPHLLLLQQLLVACTSMKLEYSNAHVHITCLRTNILCDSCIPLRVPSATPRNPPMMTPAGNMRLGNARASSIAQTNACTLHRSNQQRLDQETRYQHKTDVRTC